MRFTSLLFVVLALVIACFALPANAQFYWETIEFANVDSTVINGTDVDTSDAFYIAKDYVASARYAKDYPARLAFQYTTREWNDSTYVTQKLQLSLDGTNWFTHGILDTTITEDGVTCTNVTSWDIGLWGRILYTGKMVASDTVTVGGSFAKIY